jgi:hypothetical protein
MTDTYVFTGTEILEAMAERFPGVTGYVYQSGGGCATFVLTHPAWGEKRIGAGIGTYDWDDAMASVFSPADLCCGFSSEQEEEGEDSDREEDPGEWLTDGTKLSDIVDLVERFAKSVGLAWEGR